MKITPAYNYNKSAVQSAKFHRAFSGNIPSKNTKPIEKDPENPISKGMEQLDLIKASIIAGFGFGARALYEFAMDSDFIEDTFRAGQKIANKKCKPTASSLTKTALGFASWGAIIVGTIGVLAGIYAVYNAPKSMYQGEINAHKKSEDMDVYLKSNRIEKELYSQVGQKAKEAQTDEEKQHAKQQYMLLRAAKNQIPEFINM